MPIVTGQHKDQWFLIHLRLRGGKGMPEYDTTARLMYSDLQFFTQSLSSIHAQPKLGYLIVDIRTLPFS